MHKKEIMKLNGMLTRDGYSIIPLSLYFKGSRVKVEIGVCKGKKLYDKRESDAKKSAQRTIERITKGGSDI
jgi:SsrA-binding protein